MARISNNIIWLMVVLSALQALPVSANADDDVTSGIHYQFLADCYAAKRNGQKKYNIDEKTANYNAKCDHEWALKQANSLNFVSVDYLEKRLERAKSQDLASLQSSGICLDTEIDKGQCIDRLDRELLSMKLKVRNETLKFNKSRSDMATDDNRTFLNGSESIPETKKNFTILNDLYRASENQKKSKEVSKVLEPQEIDFSKDGIQENLKTNEFSQSQEVKVNDENLRKTMGLKDGQNLETANPNEENVDLKAKLDKAVSEKDPKKSKYSFKNYESDQNRKKQEETLFANKKAKKRVDVDKKTSISVMSFIDVMDGLQEQALGINKMKKANDMMKSRSPSAAGLSEPGETSIYALPRVEDFSKDKKNNPDGYIDYDIEKMLINNGSDPLSN